MESVRAAVISAPQEVSIREFDKPAPAEDALLLKIDEVGICGSDRHIYLGESAVKFPVVPGHELIGTVTDLGRAANAAMNVVGGPISEGDLVTVVPSSKPCGKCYYCLHVPDRPALCSDRTVYGLTNCEAYPHLTGGMAEYLYVGPTSWVFPVPKSVPRETAVLAEPVAVATRTVERALTPGIPHIGAGLGIGKSAVVVGGGPIGLLVAAVLREAGAGLIIVTDLMPTRLEMAKRMGADVGIDVGQTTLAERIEQVCDLTHGVGADMVFECAGVPPAFVDSLELVRRGGIVVEAGHYMDPGEIALRPHVFCQKDLDLRGVWSYPAMQFEAALRFLERTRAPLDEFISHYIPLDAVDDGINMLERPGAYKVVIRPGEA